MVAELFLAGVVTADGVIDGSLAARTARVIPDGRTFSYVLHDGGATGPRIVITQNDVRAIQLAKAALYAGVRLLMDQLGVDEVDEIRLAGAFGSQIDTTHAMILGLIPDCDLARVRSAGNAAGTGALIALLSGAARTEIEGVVRRRREDRDRRGAALPGALRRGDGVPAPDGAVPEPGAGRGAARAGGRRRDQRVGGTQRARRRRRGGCRHAGGREVD